VPLDNPHLTGIRGIFHPASVPVETGWQLLRRKTAGMTGPSISSAGPVRRASVTALCPVEGFTIDPEPLSRLEAALGAQAAAEVVARLREDLWHRLPLMGRQYARGDHGPLAANARLVAESARCLGYSGLSRCARDVVTCATRCDPAALGAVIARLARLAGQCPLELRRRLP
jgi:hypothetical protein